MKCSDTLPAPLVVGGQGEPNRRQCGCQACGRQATGICLKGGIMEARLNRPQQSQVNQPVAANDPVVVLGEKVSREVDPRKNLNLKADVKIDVQHLNFYYGAKQALYDVSLPIREHQVTALIGPSGCGKSTF